MKTRIVAIGNSQGVRIPKVLLEQSGLPEDVELRVDDGRIVIEPAVEARTGWAEAARELREREHGPADQESPVEPFPATDFDEDEWVWE